MLETEQKVEVLSCQESKDKAEKIGATKSEETNGSLLVDVKVKDHFSLPNPTSKVTFGDTTSLVLTDGTKQLILQASEDREIEAKQAATGTWGLFISRCAYTVVGLLMAGFLFVFCIQLILFLFLNLAVELGVTNRQDGFSFSSFFGTLLSIPVFAIGLANAMTIASTFVVDTYKGQYFMKTLFPSKSVVMDWITFFIYLLIPLFAGVILLFSENDRWWEFTSLTWFICVFVYFCLFAITVIYYEIKGCVDMIQSTREQGKMTFFDIIKEAILLKQKQLLAGTVVESIITSNLESREYGDSNEQIDKFSVSCMGCKGFMGCMSCMDFYKDVYVYKGIYARITLCLTKCCSCLFKELDEPKPYTAVQAVRGKIAYFTSKTWSLDGIYFRDRKGRFAAVVKGNDHLRHSQLKSSFICSLLGNATILALMIAVLTWFDVNGAVIGFAVAIYVIFAASRILTSTALYSVLTSVKKHKLDDDDDEKALYYVKEEWRITEPSESFCWTVFGLEVVFFFVLPIVSLYTSGFHNIAAAFLPISIITCVRRYLNVTTCFKELGTLAGIEENNRDVEGNIDKDSEWREKHRLSQIVGKISHGERHNFWIIVFAVFLVIFMTLFMAAITFGVEPGLTVELKTLDDFEYEGKSHFPYPSCSLGRGIETPDKDESALADFAFLSTLAYTHHNVTQKGLDAWFGENVAVDLEDELQAFRVPYEAKNGESAVRYKLLNFTSTNLQIVAIRGTTNANDALTDAQLWSSAALAQFIRAALPLGEIWTPILRHLVTVTSLIESNSLQDKAFYKQTTAFVESLIDKNYNIALTGHSLGGGLAMISGAQTQQPALGISGPNAMISRDTFVPSVSKEDLDTYTFNVVPDRDPVPRIDDLAQNYQRIACRSDTNAPVDCHFGARTLCEILYTCGTQGRPVPCKCREYGYKEPKQLGNRTYEEAYAQSCSTKNA